MRIGEILYSSRAYFFAFDPSGNPVALLRVDQIQRLKSDPDVRYWLGFDIASALYGGPKMGSKGSKSTGPGSERIRCGLSAPAQQGFNASTKFHLSRSY
jgi:hypothetical protein